MPRALAGKSLFEGAYHDESRSFQAQLLTAGWPACSASDQESSVDHFPELPSLRVIDGRFRIERVLGAGAFGTVYCCFDEQLRQHVAVKLAHEQIAEGSEGCDKLLHEARAAAQVKHPNIVGVKDVGKTAGRPYVVFDLIAGHSLAAVIERGQYTLAEAVKWVADLADGLHEAHRNRLVHRDVKPENVLINEQRQALLTDFGLARIDDHFYVRDHGRVGTVPYMSPEQAAGMSHLATSQSDLYALGVVLYELLCGRRPFESCDDKDLCEQIRYKAVTPPRTLREDLPVALERICLRALAKKPEERFSTGKDLAEALRCVLPKRPKTHFLTTAAVVFGLTAAVATAGAVSWPRISGMTQNPSMSLPLAPEVKIAIEPAATESAARMISAGDAAWAAGDGVTLQVQLNRPGYVYLYWYENTGGRWEFVQRLSPDSLDAQRAVAHLKSNRLRISGGAGSDLVLAVTAETACTPQVEAELSQRLQQSLSALPAVTEVCEVSPAAHQTPEIASKVRRVQRGFEPVENPMSERMIGLPISAEVFAEHQFTYHGWLIPRR